MNHTAPTPARREASRPLVILVAITLLTLPTGLAFAKSAYPDGEAIQITGVVTDPTGQPISGVTVSLEGSRRDLSWTRMKKVKRHPDTIITYTDANGEFSFTWKWHHYYNNFELRASVPVRQRDGSERLETLTGALINDFIVKGSPVDVPLKVRDTAFLDDFRAFLASLDTDEKRNTYDRFGKPDKVETVQLADREEISWWYFDLGKTYRFTDGAITEVVEFDPVSGFSD